MKVGQRIEKLRKASGWTRKQLAGNCSSDWIDAITIRQIEYGRQIRNFDQAIVEVSSALGVSIPELFGVQTKGSEIALLAKQIQKLSKMIAEKSGNL